MVAALAAAVMSVGVGAHEYRFAVYRPKVKRGVVRLNIHNYGEDDHNVVVTGPRKYVSPVSPDIASGENHTLRLRLKRRGRYWLVCVKGGHAERGMRAYLKVR
jgi:plastocyanin